MKLNHLHLLVAGLLILYLFLGSCTSYKQVACPPIEGKKQLTNQSIKPKTRNLKRKKTSYSKSYRNFTANKYRYKTKKVETVAIKSENLFPESDLIRIPLFIGQVNPQHSESRKLIASTETITGSYGKDLDIISRLSKSYTGSELTQSVEIKQIKNREQRLLNRKIIKELRSNLGVENFAQDQVSDKSAKPAAIAALFLGIAAILGILLFPFEATIIGILAIIFGAVALKRIKTNPSLKNRTKAIVGLVLGIVAISISLIVFIGFAFG